MRFWPGGELIFSGDARPVRRANFLACTYQVRFNLLYFDHHTSSALNYHRAAYSFAHIHMFSHDQIA